MQPPHNLPNQLRCPCRQRQLLRFAARSVPESWLCLLAGNVSFRSLSVFQSEARRAAFTGFSGMIPPGTGKSPSRSILSDSGRYALDAMQGCSFSICTRRIAGLRFFDMHGTQCSHALLATLMRERGGQSRAARCQPIKKKITHPSATKEKPLTLHSVAGLNTGSYLNAGDRFATATERLNEIVLNRLAIRKSISPCYCPLKAIPVSFHRG